MIRIIIEDKSTFEDIKGNKIKKYTLGIYRKPKKVTCGGKVETA